MDKIKKRVREKGKVKRRSMCIVPSTFLYCHEAQSVLLYLLKSSQKFRTRGCALHGGLHNGLCKRLGASRLAHKEEGYPQFNADCHHEDILSEGSIPGNVWA